MRMATATKVGQLGSACLHNKWIDGGGGKSLARLLSTPMMVPFPSVEVFVKVPPLPTQLDFSCEKLVQFMDR